MDNFLSFRSNFLDDKKGQRTGFTRTLLHGPAESCYELAPNRGEKKLLVPKLSSKPSDSSLLMYRGGPSPPTKRACTMNRVGFFQVLIA
jgi:hypothetical protein